MAMTSQDVELQLKLPKQKHKKVKVANSLLLNMDHLTSADDKNCTNDRASDSDNSSSDNRPNIQKSDGTFHALSGLYAQIIVVVAATLVFTEVLHGPIPLFFFHGYLFTYLVGGSIIYFLAIYMRMLVQKCPGWLNRSDEDADKQYTNSLFGRNFFVSGVSVYLRIGVVVFGLATLISNGLEVASIFTMPYDCMDPLNLAQPVLRGVFTFLQMHFLFMNVREVAYSSGWIRHAALMHLVATNVAIWVRLVLWESAKDWLEAIHVKHNSSLVWPPKEFNFTLHTLESDTKSLVVSRHKEHHKVYFTTNCWWRTPDDEKTEDLIELHMCLQNSTIGAIWEKAMPYLYPFIIQYCLVAAGVLYIIWSSFQSRRAKLQHLTAASVYKDDPTSKSQINCKSSTKGFFLGLLFLVVGIIALILFFVLAEDKEFNAVLVIAALRCVILAISALAAVLGLFQIRKMKRKTKRQRKLAELLQRAGMLAVYVYGICNMIAGAILLGNFQNFTESNRIKHIFTESYSQNLLIFLDGMLMVFQACLQSLFIHQVCKKRLGPSNLDNKPGRQVVIFLVFMNMVLWLFESFTTQHKMSSILQKIFYGAVSWSLIGRMVLPLVIFYRFHSAVVLMEAWRKSYRIKEN